MFVRGLRPDQSPSAYRNRNPMSTLRRRAGVRGGSTATTLGGTDLTSSVVIRPFEEKDQEKVYSIWRAGSVKDMPEQVSKDTVRDVLKTPKYLLLFASFVALLTTSVSFAVASYGLVPKTPDKYLSAVLLILFGSICGTIAFIYGFAYWATYKRMKGFIDKYEEMRDIKKSFSQKGWSFLVAEQGGEILGCAAVFPRKPHFGGPAEDQKAEPADSTKGEVGRVAVAPAARGKGVAKLLMSELEVAARALGYTSLWLVTAANPAKFLYKKLGYRQEAIVAKMIGLEAATFIKQI